MEKQFSITDIPREVLCMLDLLNDEHPEISQVEWTLFLEYARHHRLYPILCEKVKHHKDIPQYVKEKMRDDQRNNMIHMFRLSAEIANINELFKNEHIQTLFLKGPTLAKHLYGDLARRASGDIDILIPINELNNADSILIEAGYIKHEYIHSVLDDWKWRHHHLTYYHPKKHVKVELHWRLHPGPKKEPDFEQLWERRQSTFLTDKPVQILGNEDMFYFLLTHGVRHGFSRMCWLFDIHSLMKKQLSYIYINRLLKRYHCSHMCGQVFILLASLFQAKIHPQMMKLTRRKKAIKAAQYTSFYIRNRIRLHDIPLPKHVSRYHKRYLFFLMPLREKCLFILSFLYPYPEDKKVFPLPRQLHLLYFPLRPFIWMLKKIQPVAYE